MLELVAEEMEENVDHDQLAQENKEKCAFDITIAVSSLLKGSLAIVGAVNHNCSSDAETCASWVTRALGYSLLSVGYISNSVSSCASVENLKAECAGAIIKLIATMNLVSG